MSAEAAVVKESFMKTGRMFPRGRARNLARGMVPTQEQRKEQAGPIYWAMRKIAWVRNVTKTRVEPVSRGTGSWAALNLDVVDGSEGRSGETTVQGRTA